MAYVEPIADKHHVKAAARFIKDNFDPAYSLIWQIGIETGYRITDITELKYSDIDHDNCTIKVAENKGTRSNQARARLKVLATAWSMVNHLALSWDSWPKWQLT